VYIPWKSDARQLSVVSSLVVSSLLFISICGRNEMQKRTRSPAASERFFVSWPAWAAPPP
jgi:hypothetical protein